MYGYKKIWEKSFVNPTPTVIHAEGATNGTNVNSGIKISEINRSKFIKNTLMSYQIFLVGIVLNLKIKIGIRGNILIIDQCIPTLNQDSGSKDMDCIIKAFLISTLDPSFCIE